MKIYIYFAYFSFFYGRYARLLQLNLHKGQENLHIPWYTLCKFYIRLWLILHIPIANFAYTLCKICVYLQLNLHIPYVNFTYTLLLFYIYYIIAFGKIQILTHISGLLVRPALPLTFYYTINFLKIQIFWRISQLSSF